MRAHWSLWSEQMKDKYYLSSQKFAHNKQTKEDWLKEMKSIRERKRIADDRALRALRVHKRNK